MKKSLLLFLILLSIITINSCKKEIEIIIDKLLNYVY